MSQVSVNTFKSFQQALFSWLYSFWKFSRPHTIVGTSLSVFALYFIALATTENSVTPENIRYLLGALLACLLGNVYIVGLNQLEDVSIDQINKPHLPLASGEFSQRQGRWIVGIAGILAIGLGAILGGWLLGTVSISLMIGTAYSLPPFRLKQFPFLAALCIFTVRGVMVNLGLFLYFSSRVSGRAFLVPSVWILTLFVVVFTIAIAIFKDVPDLEGDKEYNITTFTILLGKVAIFKITFGIILLCYLGMIFLGIIQVSEINSGFLLISHVILLILLSWRTQQVNLEDKGSITQFYQFIWKLFFLEYLLFPMACLI